MRRLKKLSAFVCAMALCLSVGVYAAADENRVLSYETGTAVEIESPAEGETELPVLPDYIPIEKALFGDNAPQMQYIPEDGEEFEEVLSSGEQTSIYKANILYTYTKEEQEQINRKGDEIISGIEDSWDDLRKLIYINDYICENTVYDYSYSNYDLYDGIIDGCCVCSGYSKYMWYLCWRMDIDCRIISSKKLNHAWNLVDLDGKWYLVDPTWNDQQGYYHHPYFLKSDGGFGHVPEDEIIDWVMSYENNIPGTGYARSAKYDNAFWTSGKGAIGFTEDGFFCSDRTTAYYVDNSFNKTALFDANKYVWRVPHSPNGSYYTGKYMDMFFYDGRLYYNSDKDIFSCATDGTDVKTVYALSGSDREDYNIYGFSVDKNVIKMNVSDLWTGTPTSGYEYVVPKKKTARITAFPTPKVLLYSGKPQILAEAGTAENGTLLYSLDGKNFSENIPAGTKAGKYKILIKAKGNAGYLDSPVTFVMASIETDLTAKVITPPKGLTLAYTGEMQQLFIPGTAENGVIMMSANGIDFISGYYVGTAKGAYTYWYKVKGDPGYKDSELFSVTAYIGDPVPIASPTKKPEALTLEYTGKEQALITAGTSDNGRFWYKLADREGSYSSAVPKAEAPGKYTVLCWLTGNDGYGNMPPYPITAEILNPKTDEPTAEVDIAPVGLTQKSLTDDSGNAKYQKLFTSGTARNGKIVFSYDGVDYQESIPVGSDDGVYPRWFKVKGDEGYKDSQPYRITATIGDVKTLPKQHEPTALPEGLKLPYNGSEQALVKAGSGKYGTFYYKIYGREGPLYTSIPTAKEPGKYIVLCWLVGKEGYAKMHIYPVEAEIYDSNAIEGAVFSEDSIVVTYADGRTEKVSPSEITPELAEIMSATDCAAAVNAFSAEKEGSGMLTKGQLAAIKKTIAADKAKK